MILIQSTLVISKSKAPSELLQDISTSTYQIRTTLESNSRYPYFDISDVQNGGKYQSNNQISQMNM